MKTLSLLIIGALSGCQTQTTPAMPYYSPSPPVRTTPVLRPYTPATDPRLQDAYRVIDRAETQARQHENAKR
jgi:hypothetical protein